MTRFVLPAALALALALAPVALQAQTLRPDARPASGTLQPRADRAPEMLDVTVRTGSETGMPGCTGTVDSSAPDAVVEWAGGADLRIVARASFDATLVVARPDGTWACNDDAEGTSPAVEIAGAPRGRYAVWVGSSYDPDVAGQPVTLIAGRGPAPVADPSARPTGGTARLEAGFEAQSGADTQEVDAGGLDGVMPMALTPNDEYGCVGFIDAAAPSRTVSYGGGGLLAFTATSTDVENTTDLVLVVHTPGGEWPCNDDYGSLDPAVVLPDAARGDYAVWVGTLQSRARSEPVRAVLTVSETEPPVPDDGDDFSEEPTGPYGEGTYMALALDERPGPRLVVGDAPVEASASVLPTGPNPVSGPTCSGYITASATADVVMAGDGPFGITATTDVEFADLVLVVRTPEGAWYCSDDADGTNPGIQFGTADEPAVEAGTYRVWVGTFGNPDEMEGMDASDMQMPPSGPIGVVVHAARGEIVVTEADYGMDMGMDGPSFTEGTYSGADLRPDAAAPTLAAGAAPATITAGGTLLNPVAGDACAGFVDARPTFAFTATAEALEVTATSDDDDLVMIVQTPSGRWLCSDDAQGSNPAVRTDEPGRHAVWVGTYTRSLYSWLTGGGQDVPVPRQ